MIGAHGFRLFRVCEVAQKHLLLSLSELAALRARASNVTQCCIGCA